MILVIDINGTKSSSRLSVSIALNRLKATRPLKMISWINIWCRQSRVARRFFALLMCVASKMNFWYKIMLTPKQLWTLIIFLSFSLLRNIGTKNETSFSLNLNRGEWIFKVQWVLLTFRSSPCLSSCLPVILYVCLRGGN